METILAKFNYWIYIILMMIGLYAMIAKNNLIKKLVGMVIFQTAIILFYVSIGVKADAGIPILEHDLMPHGPEPPHELQGPEVESWHEPGKKLPEIEASRYANPIPHVLMLTAIVVGVSTLGVALSITQKIYQVYGTLEEDEILQTIKRTHNGEIGNG